MAMWDIDLTTRAGAREAARQGAIACFVFCGMGVLGMVVLGSQAGFATTDGISVIIGAGIEIVVALIAAFRLRAGKGAYWTAIAAVLLVIELIAKVLALSPGGLFIGVPVLVYMINGIRGALALKKSVGFEDDDVEVFS